jgi:hypothetical protein
MTMANMNKNAEVLAILDAAADHMQKGILLLNQVRTGSMPGRPTFVKTVPPITAPVITGKRALPAGLVAWQKARAVEKVAALTIASKGKKAKAAPIVILTEAPKPHRNAKAHAIVAAMYQKGGVTPAGLREITGWPIGPAMLNRLAVTHGFTWEEKGIGTDKRRYIAKKAA